MIEVVCKICKKKFQTKPFFLKRGQGVYCSNKCHYADKNGSTFHCSTCGENIYRTPSEVRCSKSKKFFCSKSCQTIWRNGEFSGKKSLNWKGGYSTYRKVLSKSSHDKRCLICEEGDLSVLVVHHIDQNRKNFNVENLVWLCHNCHYLIHHDKVEMKKFMVSIV